MIACYHFLFRCCLGCRRKDWTLLDCFDVFVRVLDYGFDLQVLRQSLEDLLVLKLLSGLGLNRLVLCDLASFFHPRVTPFDMCIREIQVDLPESRVLVQLTLQSW